MRGGITLNPSANQVRYNNIGKTADMLASNSNSDDTSNKSLINEIAHIDNILQHSTLLELVDSHTRATLPNCYNHIDTDGGYRITKDNFRVLCRRCAFIYEMQNSKGAYEDLEDIQKYKCNLINAFMKTLSKYHQQFCNKEKTAEIGAPNIAISFSPLKRTIEVLESEVIKAIKEYFKKLKSSHNDINGLQDYLQDINKTQIEKVNKKIVKFMADVEENFYKIIFNIELDPFKEIMEFYTTKIRMFDKLLQKEASKDTFSMSLDFIKKDLQDSFNEKLNTIINGLNNNHEIKRPDLLSKISNGNSTAYDLKSLKSQSGVNSHVTKLKELKQDSANPYSRVASKNTFKNSPDVSRREKPIKIHPKKSPDSPNNMKKKIIHNTSVSYPSAKKQDTLIIQEEDHGEGPSYIYENESYQKMVNEYISGQKSSLNSIEEVVREERVQINRRDVNQLISKVETNSSIGRNKMYDNPYLEIDKDLLSQLPIIKDANSKLSQMTIANSNKNIRPRKDTSDYLSHTQNTHEEVSKAHRQPSNTELPVKSKPPKTEYNRCFDKPSVSRDYFVSIKDKRQLTTANKRIFSPKFVKLDKAANFKSKMTVESKVDKCFTQSDNKNNNLNRVSKNTSGQYFSTKDHRKSVIDLHKKLSTINTKDFIFKLGVRKQLSGGKMIFIKKTID